MRAVVLLLLVLAAAAVLVVDSGFGPREVACRTDDPAADARAVEALRDLRRLGCELVADGALPPYAARRAHAALRTAQFRERRAGALAVTVGKRRRIELCVRGLAPAERTRVFLHELAHSAAQSTGHTAEHARLEAALLDAAHRAGHDVRAPAPARCKPCAQPPP